MSEAVLSIDVSSRPARVIVAQREGRELKLLESQHVELGSFREIFAAEEPALEATAEGSSPVVPSSSTVGVAAEKLRVVLKSLRAQWYGSIIVIPAAEYLSLSIELPFSDAKQIARVIGLEVQDLVPFDVSDFLLDYTVVAPGTNGQHEILVGMLPRQEVRRIIQFCKLAEIDPHLICTPPTLLGAAHHLAPHYFEQDTALVWAEKPNCFVSVVIGGKLRATRSLVSSDDSALIFSGADFEDALTQEIRLAVAAAERRYERTFNKVYLFGSALGSDELQRVLGRSIVSVTVSELVQGEKESNSLAPLGACFVESVHEDEVINFRCGEFAFRPQFTELISGFRSLLPHAALAVGVLLLTLFMLYVLRVREINQLQSAMHSEIRSVIPNINLEAGKELDKLGEEIRSIEKQLKDLGSLSRLSVLDALLELSRDIPKNITIDKLTLKEDRITISGKVESYAAIDALEKALQEKRTVYCSVEVRQQASIGQNKDFELVLHVC